MPPDPATPAICHVPSRRNSTTGADRREHRASAVGRSRHTLEELVDDDPIVVASERAAGGDHRGARRILAELLMLDLRCLHGLGLALWALKRNAYGIPVTFSHSSVRLIRSRRVIVERLKVRLPAIS